MYTLCYILTDDRKLHYYNQLMISLASLRMHSFAGKVCVLMDDKTAGILRTDNYDELSGFGVETKVVTIQGDYTQEEKSRYLKTGLREHLSGDVLFIDTDTVIVRDLPIEVSEHDIALVQDLNWKQIDGDIRTTVPASHPFVRYRQLLAEKCGYSLDLSSRYFNSGVIWVRDTELVHAFFAEWHSEWEKCRACGVIKDQPSLNDINARYGHVIADLDGCWNVQVARPMALIYLDRSIIIHYYSYENKYRLSRSEIQKQGYKSKEVREILSDPLNAFYPFTFMPIDGATEEIIYCRAFAVLKHLYVNHRQLYRGINFLLSIPDRIRGWFR